MCRCTEYTKLCQELSGIISNQNGFQKNMVSDTFTSPGYQL